MIHICTCNFATSDFNSYINHFLNCDIAIDIVDGIFMFVHTNKKPIDLLKESYRITSPVDKKDGFDL